MKAASAQYGAPASAGGEPSTSAAAGRTVWTISASRGTSNGSRTSRMRAGLDVRDRAAGDQASTSASMSATVSPGSVRRSSPSTQRPG